MTGARRKTGTIKKKNATPVRKKVKKKDEEIKPEKQIKMKQMMMFWLKKDKQKEDEECTRNSGNPQKVDSYKELKTVEVDDIEHVDDSNTTNHVELNVKEDRQEAKEEEEKEESRIVRAQRLFSRTQEEDMTSYEAWKRIRSEKRKREDQDQDRDSVGGLIPSLGIKVKLKRCKNNFVDCSSLGVGSQGQVEGGTGGDVDEGQGVTGLVQRQGDTEPVCRALGGKKFVDTAGCVTGTEGE